MNYAYLHIIKFCILTALYHELFVKLKYLSLLSHIPAYKKSLFENVIYSNRHIYFANYANYLEYGLNVYPLATPLLSNIKKDE